MMRRRTSILRFLILVVFWLASPAISQAEVYGGIEIGAKGIRAIAVDVPGDAGEPKIVFLENKNTTLVADLAAKKQFSPTSLGETAEIVGGFARKIRTDFKLADKRLYIVGSSGLFAPLEGDEKLVKANKERLVESIRQSTGATMDFVSVVREAELTITSVVPASLRKDSVLLDIGSGNTKGGAEQPGMGLITFGIPFGTVSFADRVKKDADKDNFPATAARLRKEIVMPKLQDSLQGKPELTRRKRVYLAGGAVWALATYMKPAERGNFVKLSLGDVKAFSRFLLEHPNELPNTDLSRVADEETKKLAAKDMNQVRKTFTRDQLVAGVEVLNALAEGFHLDAPDRQLYFARNAYIGWILGYTVEKAAASR
jgi:exopolyphosphatase/pppGpp-phosphohydrolase